jgi:hypothetical protein
MAGVLGALILVISAYAVPAYAVPATPDPASARSSDPATRPAGQVDRSAIPPAERDRVLSRHGRTAADLAWTTSGDATGFHVLVAEARTGYTWRTLATLAESGFDTDRWIGNVASRDRASEPSRFTHRDNSPTGKTCSSAAGSPPSSTSEPARSPSSA